MLGHKKRPRKRRDGNTHLRRLTQAYLTSVTQLQPLGVRTAYDKVDGVYYLVQQLILKHQSVTSGLFPRYSKNREIGFVKDSIYCALACWTCSLAYKRLDDDRGRQTELRQSAVKAMRGIMFCWMQQLNNLNHFKENISPEFSLHARFDLHTGMILATPNEKKYGHLQMDLIALYLLALVQMTAAGIQVIYTHDEVCFVQNLVFYIERTYRTPDFGMWEIGSRYNVGERELHASSLGMVKAALEAINGFNLYGTAGTSSSVIYVDIDGHNRNRTTFETILPRESNSKNTDAALLPSIGWPAFATHDAQLYERTFDKCIRRLEGRYGLKRFLRDGYHTELEDASKQYYDEHETSRFQNIECQFPVFFAYIAITAHFRGERKLSNSYWEKAKDMLVSNEKTSYLVMPECYIIDEEHMHDERMNPNSQEFYPASPYEFGHHLWSNAVYLIALLLKDEYIHSTDMDPICRHLPASQRPKYQNRHSVFQSSMEGDPVVQVVLIAESSRLQMMLSTYGIDTQTPHDLEPVRIWPSWKMVKVFEFLGKNEKMGLSGRPGRPFGPLNTSKIFKRFGDTILCYPLLFEVKNFYINADPAVLINEIKLNLEFISRRWKLTGRPTFCMVLREETMSGEYFSHMLDLLISLKNGCISGIRVRVGRVHQLLNSGCMEHVDFATNDDDNNYDSFEELDDTKSQVISRVSIRDIHEDDTQSTEHDYDDKSDQELCEIVRKHNIDALRKVALAIGILSRRYGMVYIIDGESLEVRMERVYRQACARRRWWIVRYCAAKLRKVTNSLAPSITNMLVRGKQISVGVIGYREITIAAPTTPDQIADALFSSYPEDEPQVAVLQQELIIACSDLIAQKPYAFDGVLTIRLSWLADAMSLMLDYMRSAGNIKKSSALGMLSLSTFSSQANICAKKSALIRLELVQNLSVYDLSPIVVKDVVCALLTRKYWHLLTPLQSRRLNGSLNRVPTNFYDSVWKILERTQGGIVIAGQHLPQQPTLSDMTPFELTFSHKIESMMSAIDHPEYRQILVELLCIIAVILERNRELIFSDKLDLDELISTAFRQYCSDHEIVDKDDMTPFYELDDSDLTKNSTANYFARAVIDSLLNGIYVNRRKMTTFMPSDPLACMAVSESERSDNQGYNSCLVS
ncbi:phosphorylase kinase alpha/beta [Onchocerca flexuosa]|uniref:Phosphorylase b kinase regulatory subunit n=2 Tax=Onchocerca flexuosa TaxID=387005 RepID=A0A238C0H4_9BILA|nr:phosphorylase kinase alpha/beta [Onchocerca flexuosa]